MPGIRLIYRGQQFQLEQVSADWWMIASNDVNYWFSLNYSDLIKARHLYFLNPEAYAGLDFSEFLVKLYPDLQILP